MKKVREFFTESISEFKKVIWPSKRETMRLTAFVLSVSLGVALFVWGADILFKHMLSLLVLK